ncbi:MAG: quinolinate synthase NadA [Polyangiaceae bacterium]
MTLQKHLPTSKAAEKTLDPSLDLEDEIAKLKKQKNAIVLAHYYQDGDIQDVADVVGDSLQLAQAAAKTKADVICFAGVHFMAETAKILNPDKTVVLPDLSAGCSLADGCPPAEFAAWIAKHTHGNDKPVVVSYINCSAEVKALSDYIVTSSNAEKIVAQIPENKKVLFAPDKNLGAFIEKKLGRKMELWQGSCIVHETFSERKLIGLKERHPGAPILAHPECEPAILKMADYIGSTTGILKTAIAHPSREVIVVTEAGILHALEKQAAEAGVDKVFIPAPPMANCACNECPYMKKNTLEKVYFSLRDLDPQITMPADLMSRALLPIQRMLALS